MKVKPLVTKKIKYNKIKFNLDITRPIAKDTDRDGIPNYLDCAPFNSSKQGLLHDWLQKQRLLKERKNMAKLDIEPLKEEQEYFDEKLSKAETGIEDFKHRVEKRTEQYRKNIQAGLKNTDKNIQRVAQHYSKRAESPQSDPTMRKPISQVKKCYLIPAPQKAYYDWEKNEPSSIPRYKRDKYVPFKPHTIKPLNAPVPDYIIKRRLIRTLNFLQETQQFEKLSAIITQLRGEQV